MSAGRVLPAPTGTCRWLDVDQFTGNRWLRITTVNGVSADYEVEPVVGGYHLWKWDPEKFTTTLYRVSTRPVWKCSCPDSQYRERECKHCRSLRAALVKLEGSDD